MKSERLLYWLAGFAFVFFTACDVETELKPNMEPTTRIFVNAVNLDSTDKLKSIVNLAWSGTDQDGYVIGYEISFDNINYSFVTKTDSIFKFLITEASGQQNFDFYVRAIDNDSARDLTPEHLVLPLINTPPTCAFVDDKLPKDTVLIGIHALFTYEDVDGEDNIRDVEIRVNNGNWLKLKNGVDFISLIAEDPKTIGTQNAIVYQGPDMVAENGSLANDFVVGGYNQIYLRITDNANGVSNIDTTAPLFVKPQSSDLLVIDAHPIKNDNFLERAPVNIYKEVLNDVYKTKGYDFLDFYNSNQRPFFWDQYMTLIPRLYTKIFWFANESSYIDTEDPDNPDPNFDKLLIETASPFLLDFLNHNGKLFLTTNLPKSLDTLSVLFQLTPMQGLSRSTGDGQQARMVGTSKLVPQQTGWDTLSKTTDPFPTTLSGVDPFYLSPENQTINALYKADSLVKLQGWQGPDYIAARQTNQTGQTNQVFFSVELHKFYGNTSQLKSMFNKILNEEFNW